MSDTIVADVTQLRMNTFSPDPMNDAKLNNNIIQYPPDNVAFSDFLNLEKIDPNMYNLEMFSSGMSWYKILIIIVCFLIIVVIMYKYFNKNKNTPFSINQSAII